MTSNLFRTSSIWRPLSVIDKNGKQYVLRNIIIYDENGIIFQVGSGYFDTDEELTINGEIVKKLKEVFDKKVNYVLKDKNYYSRDNNDSILYIHKDNIELKDLGLIKEYSYVYRIYSVNGIKVKVYVKSLNDELLKLNNEAEDEIKKLEEFFGYNKKGIDESKLLEIFSKIQDLNRAIIEENKRIQDYKV